MMRQVGHRKRLKERFGKTPARSLPDYELLELLLYYVIPRQDTKPIAKTLIKKFRSLRGILSAEPNELKHIKGINDASILYLKLIYDLFTRLHIDPQEQNFHVLNNWAAVLNYCYMSMGFRSTESFRVLYLNKKNILIADEMIEHGTVDKIALYPREIAKQAISHNASAIILVHNHPSGDTNPSQEDITITTQLKNILKLFQVMLHDHLIIAKGQHFSFKANSLLD